MLGILDLLRLADDLEANKDELLSNQKVQRTGQIRQANCCYLNGFRFVFNKRGSGGTRMLKIVSR